MDLHRYRCALLAGTAIALAPAASAQLVVTNDDSAAGEPNAWLIDVNTDVATPLWSGMQAWGAAADDANRTIWANNGSTLYSVDYDTLTPTAGVPIVDATGATQAFVSLAWANGNLYGTKNIANEAVWQIDTETGVASVVYEYTDPDYDFGGLSYNPSDGLFYGTNDDASPFGAGLFSIDVFGGGGINLVAPYPAGETDIDGTAVGDNKVYFVTDEPGDIYVYDLLAGEFISPLTNPMTTSEIFSGGAWAPGLIPTPATLTLLGFGGLAAARRRR